MPANTYQRLQPREAIARDFYCLSGFGLVNTLILLTIFFWAGTSEAWFYLDRKRMHRESTELLRQLGIKIPIIQTEVSYLSGVSGRGSSCAGSTSRRQTTDI